MVAGALADRASSRLGPLPALTGWTGSGDRVTVVVSGVGSVAAATAAALGCLPEPPDLLLSLGVGGAYPGSGLDIGGVAVASVLVAADLGADSPAGFLDLPALGLGGGRVEGEVPLVELVAARLADAGLVVSVGPVLTVSTATGTAARAAELVRRHDPVAEAMEGYGVAHVAALVRRPVLEVRAVSNAVGDRDRASWDIPSALLSLRVAAAVLFGGALGG